MKAGSGKILYPPFVFTSIWLFDVSFYATGLVQMNPLHSITYLCIVLACLAFTLGGAATALLPDWILRTKTTFWTHEQSTGTGRKLFITSLILAFPIFIMLIYRSGTNAGSFSLANAKAAQLGALVGQDSPHSSLSPMYVLFALSTTFICYIEKRDKLSFLCIALTCIVGALSGGRTLILQLIVGIVCIYLIRTKKDSVRSSYRIAAIAAFLALASALVFLVKNMAQVGNDAGQALQFYILGYVVSGLGPLDYVLTHPAEYMHIPNHTFKFLLQAGQVLGLGTTPPPAMDEYLWIPFPTNVYTMFKPYITDFGFEGMLVAMFLLAFLQTTLYRRALRGNNISLLLTALLLYATILSPFDDLYIEVKNFGVPVLLGIFYFGVLNRVQFSLAPRWSTQAGVRKNE
jgi:oligosaccharide repeat unit polymerase